MILCVGFHSELDTVRLNLDQDFPHALLNINSVQSEQSFEKYVLVVIGPYASNPVKIVQAVAANDKLISIIVFAEAAKFSSIKQSLHFSLAVGRNALCVIFNLSTNYSVIFQTAINRTKQKRSFSHLNLSADVKLPPLTSNEIELDGVGQLLEHAPIGAMLIDKDLNVVGANLASRKMFAQLGAHRVSLSTLLPARYIELIRTSGSTPNGLPFSAEDVSGNYYEVSISAVSDSQRILLISDVTDRRERDHRIAAILESLPHIAWTADEYGAIDFLNEGWKAYTGRNASEGLSEGWISFVHHDDLMPLKVRWQETIDNKRPFQQASRLRRFDGSYRWHLIRATPMHLKNRGILLWVGTITDIHDQIRSNEELEKKVIERTRQLTQSNSELEQFAHISSHDLQEPLRKIQTFANIANDAIDKESPEIPKIKLYIEKIIATSQRLTTLLKDLLKYSKINEQEPDSPVDLNVLVQEIKGDLEMTIAQHNAIVKAEQLPVVTGRPLQLKQLFYNIISNGLKYRKDDTAPVISIFSRAMSRNDLKNVPMLKEDFYWEIIVKDNGIGFDQKYADQIFTVFQRLHTRDAYDGTGIGLAIAKKVAANHNGDLFALSSAGKGAEFHIVLPADQPIRISESGD